jgi:hypothetical protein
VIVQTVVSISIHAARSVFRSIVLKAQHVWWSILCRIDDCRKLMVPFRIPMVFGNESMVSQLLGRGVEHVQRRVDDLGEGGAFVECGRACSGSAGQAHLVCFPRFVIGFDVYLRLGNTDSIFAEERQAAEGKTVEPATHILEGLL